MALFIICTVVGVIALSLWTPLPNPKVKRPQQPQFQYRHPEAGPMQQRPRVERRQVRFED